MSQPFILTEANFAERVRKRPGLYFGDPTVPALARTLLNVFLVHDRPDWNGKLVLSIRNSKTTSIVSIVLSNYSSAFFDPPNVAKRFTLDGSSLWESEVPAIAAISRRFLIEVSRAKQHIRLTVTPDYKRRLQKLPAAEKDFLNVQFSPDPATFRVSHHNPSTK